MVEVTLVPFGPCKTNLWVSAKVANDIAKFLRHGDPDGRYWKKIKWACAVAGFEICERSDWPIVKHEWEGVYRIGIRTSLFRLIGFYEDGLKRDFIVIDDLMKAGQKLSSSDRECIERVVEVKKSGSWKKKVTNGWNPRLTGRD